MYFHRLTCRSILLLPYRWRQYPPPKQCAHIPIHSVLYPQKAVIFISASSCKNCAMKIIHSVHTTQFQRSHGSFLSDPQQTPIICSCLQNMKCPRRTNTPAVKYFITVLNHSFKTSFLELLLYQYPLTFWSWVVFTNKQHDEFLKVFRYKHQWYISTLLFTITLLIPASNMNNTDLLSC
jgi:hypothetical protein